MQLSYDVLNILIFLIPGFFSIILYNSIVTRKETDNYRLTIESLIYSLIVYTLASCIFQKSIFIIGKTTEKEGVKYFLNYDVQGLAVVLLLAIALPFLLGFLNNNNLLSKIYCKLHISRKTSRVTTWLDVFSDVNKYIIVNLKDGRRIFGWPSYYSSTPEEGMLYLRDPAWINENNEYVDLDLDGLFLVEKNNIDYIEMMNHPQPLLKEPLWKRIKIKVFKK